MTAAADLQALCARAFMRDASTPAIEFEGRWHGWGMLRQTAADVTRVLAASGAADSAQIAFVPRTRPSAIATLLGLIAAGRSVRMIYGFQSPTAIARDIARVNPAIVIAAAADMTNEVREVLARSGAAAIQLHDVGASALPGFEQVTGEGFAAAEGELRIEILTSGTTGTPKPFPVTFEMISRHLVRADELLTGPDAAMADAAPTLLYFPLGNISGLYTTLPALLRGQRAILLDRFSLDGWRDYVVRFRPAQTGLPPASLQALLDANVPKEDLSSIRAMGLGAAPLDPTVHRAFEARYGIPILLSYGATEFGGPVTAMTEDLRAQFGESKFTSVGRPFGGAKIRIVDAQTGDELPPGEEGLLQVVSPRIGPDWIGTSDIAMIDQDGFLFHRGRADGAIVRGGFKILPEAIERALHLHPAVTGAAVVGIASRRLGEVPAAAIQLNPSVPAPDSAVLEAHLRECIPATHIPVEWRFVNELPKNPSMKIDRPAVKRLFDDGGAANPTPRPGAPRQPDVIPGG